MASADLDNANLRAANLHGADLHLANLRDADLRTCTLQRAVLSGALLEGAKMFETDLQGTDLTGVDLIDGVDLTAGAHLYGVQHRSVLPLNAGDLGFGALYPQADGWYVSFWGEHRTLENFERWINSSYMMDKAGISLLHALYAACLAFVEATPEPSEG